MFSRFLRRARHQAILKPGSTTTSPSIARNAAVPAPGERAQAAAGQETVEASCPVTPSAPRGFEAADDGADHSRLSLLFMRRLIGRPMPVEAGPAPAEQQILEELAERVGKRPLDGDMVPRLPSVLPRVMRAMREPTTGADELAEIIAGDTAIVGEVVRLANSAAFGGVGRVESLQQAVVRLGDDGIRRLLLAATLRPIIDARGGLLGRDGGSLLWEKNQNAATAADYLARRQAAPRFPAFLTGLVSQAGLLVLARVLKASGQPGFITASDAFLTGLDQLAREVTCVVCADWQLPEEVVETTAGLLVPEQAASPLVAVASTADLLARVTVLERSGDLTEADAFDPAQLANPFAGACLDELRALGRAGARGAA